MNTEEYSVERKNTNCIKCDELKECIGYVGC